MTPVGSIGPRCDARAAELIATTIRLRILDDGPHAVIVRGGEVYALRAGSSAAEDAVRRGPAGLAGVYTETATRQQIAGDIRATMEAA